MIDIKNLTIKKAHEHLIKGDFTARELTESYLAEIQKKNPEINAYLEVFADALVQADEADKRIKAGKADILTGIPFAIKDNLLIKGRIASASSKMLENYHATYTTTAVQRLIDRGIVLLGRANMDEFAMGGSTENSAYGVTKNPHDTTRVSGGSSGGSAAAVAMDGALAALGTDTGGSIRQPSSFCGTVGLKPTYGAVSRYGAIAMGSSLDQIGPITKTVEDAEIIFNTIKGADGFDSTVISDTTFAKASYKGKKPVIGVPSAFLNQGGIDEAVLANFKDSVEKFKKIGFEVKEISLPNIGYSLAVYYVLMPAEVSANMARFDGVKYGLHKDGTNMVDDYFVSRREGLGREVRRRIMLGTYVLSTGYYDAYYNKANIVRNLLRDDFKKAFETVDVILTPTAPTPAFKIGSKTEDPIQMYLEDIFTVTANLVGVPALAVPSGFVEREGKQLPLGIQITAAHGREDTLFVVGKEFRGE